MPVPVLRLIVFDTNGENEWALSHGAFVLGVRESMEFTFRRILVWILKLHLVMRLETWESCSLWSLEGIFETSEDTRLSNPDTWAFWYILKFLPFVNHFRNRYHATAIPNCNLLFELALLTTYRSHSSAQSSLSDVLWSCILLQSCFDSSQQKHWSQLQRSYFSFLISLCSCTSTRSFLLIKFNTHQLFNFWWELFRKYFEELPVFKRNANHQITSC